MRFNINLATEPYVDVHDFLVRRGVAAGVLAIVAISLVFSAIHASRSWRATERQARALQRQIDDLESQKSDVQRFLERPENRETHERSEFLNQLIARKAFSWTEVFSDLEHIVPGPIAVQSIQPAINERDELEVHLLAIGASHESAVEFVHRLETSTHFQQARILAESRQVQTGNNQNPGQSSGWRFDIVAVYIPSFARAADAAPDQSEAKLDEQNEKTASTPPPPAPAKPTEAKNARR